MARRGQLSLSTNRSGNPEPSAARSVRPLPWQLVLLGIAGLALSGFIGSQVLGVLYTIAFPPPPPVPAGVQAIRHERQDYGVDEWLYGTETSACDVVRFFLEHGGSCEGITAACEDHFNVVRRGSPQYVTTCSGVTSFSVFAQRWQVFIAAGYSEGSSTQFRLAREVLWAGPPPP